MFCKNCGTQMADDQKFCPNCGTNNSVEAPAAPVAPVQPPVAPVASAYTAPTEPAYNQPVEQGYQYGAPTPYMPPKKSKTGLIVVISIIVAIVIAGGVCLGIFWDDLFGGKKKSGDDVTDTSTSSVVSDGDGSTNGDGEGYNDEITNSAIETLPPTTSKDATASKVTQHDAVINTNSVTTVKPTTSNTTSKNNVTNTSSVTNTTGKYLNAQAYVNSAEGKAAASQLKSYGDSVGIDITMDAAANNLYFNYTMKTDLDETQIATIKQNINSSSFKSEASAEVAKLQKYISTPNLSITYRYYDINGKFIVLYTAR